MFAVRANEKTTELINKLTKKGYIKKNIIGDFTLTRKGKKFCKEKNIKYKQVKIEEIRVGKEWLRSKLEPLAKVLEAITHTLKEEIIYLTEEMKEELSNFINEIIKITT